MTEKVMVDIYDPIEDAFRAVPLDRALKAIKAAKNLEKWLLEKGLAKKEDM